jgi:hypothetical protein
MTLGDSAFVKAVTQWMEAVADEALDPSRDRLVLFTESDSAPVVALASALDRRRSTAHGRPTLDEKNALDVLGRMIQSLAPAKRNVLLDVVVVLRVKVLGYNAPDRAAAQTMLDVAVVHGGEGEAAFKALKEPAHMAAVGRYGRVLREWRNEIREAHLHLREDAAGGPSAKATAVDAALAAYRQELINAGSTLDLLPLGLALPRIPLVDPASSWRVDVATRGEKADDRELGPAVRRRGRVLLLGEPGAGKTSALKQLAGSWATDETQLIPVLVPLQRLLQVPEPIDLMRLVSMGLAVPSDALVVEELVSRLKSGEAALFLDGLDECRERRFGIAAALEEAVQSIDAGSDVVLSTRDVAYAAVERLGWPTGRLVLPTNLDDVLRSIAAALAESQRVPATERTDWVSSRISQIESLRHEYEALRSTPLLQVLTLCALGTQSVESVAAARGHLMSDLIDDVTRRHELGVHRAGERWPGLAPEETVRLLRDGFDLVGHQLFLSQSLPRSVVAERLAGELARSWGWPESIAAGRADSVLNFWDDHSTFVAAGNPATLSARLQAFVEIAEARHAAREAAGAAEWVEGMAGDAINGEVLKLGAGLSGAIANALVSRALTNSSDWLLLVATSAIERGAAADPALVSALALVLVTRLAAMRSEPAEPKAKPRILAGPGKGTPSRPTTLDLAKALARLPMSSDLHEHVLNALEGLGDEEGRASAVAICIIRWGFAVGDYETELRRAVRTPPRPQMFVDDGWVEALVRGSDLLLAAGCDIADELRATYEHLSVYAERELEEVLLRHNQSDLLKELQAPMAASYASMRTDFARIAAVTKNEDRVWSAVIGHLASLGPCQIGREQTRRLAELADLVDCVWPGYVPASWSIRNSDQQDLVVRAFDLAILLGGFNAQVIAAQAEIVGSMTRLDSRGMLWDGASGPELSHWDQVEDVERVRAELVSMMAAGPLFAHFAVAALIHAPEPETTIDLICRALPALEPETRAISARAVLWLECGTARLAEWLKGSDPVLGVQAARRAASLWVKGEVGEEVLLDALTSSDAGVRFNAAETIAGGGRRLPEWIWTRMDAIPCQGWQCTWCGASNASEDEGCSSCHIVGNRSLGPDSPLRLKIVQPSGIQ